MGVLFMLGATFGGCLPHRFYAKSKRGEFHPRALRNSIQLGALAWYGGLKANILLERGRGEASAESDQDRWLIRDSGMGWEETGDQCWLFNTGGINQKVCEMFVSSSSVLYLV